MAHTQGLRLQISSPYISLAVFRWLWRQRIRLHLEGTGINPNPVDLHEQQLSLEQHNQAHRFTSMDNLNSTTHSALGLPRLVD